MIYEKRSQENLDSSRRDDMLNNSNEGITHLCLMANDGVENQDTSDKDDDDADADDE